jgi:hypothetical protein
MKKGDLIIGLLIILIFSPFLLIPTLSESYREINSQIPYVMSFIKFFILASIGEVLGNRIRKGGYYLKGFGLLPRAIVWGLLGISIKMAFIIFGEGASFMLKTMGLTFPTDNPADILENNFIKEGTWLQLLSAFTVSVTLNVFFAPVFMTFHKITDTHITMNKGDLRSCFKPIQFRGIITTMDWDVQWNFVIKKTIPIFWIPAQTVNFLLPGEYRVLVAAIYSIILGVILAIAANMGLDRARKQEGKKAGSKCKVLKNV